MYTYIYFENFEYIRFAPSYKKSKLDAFFSCINFNCFPFQDRLDKQTMKMTNLLCKCSFKIAAVNRMKSCATLLTKSASQSIFFFITFLQFGIYSYFDKFVNKRKPNTDLNTSIYN